MSDPLLDFSPVMWMPVSYYTLQSGDYTTA